MIRTCSMIISVCFILMLIGCGNKISLDDYAEDIAKADDAGIRACQEKGMKFSSAYMDIKGGWRAVCYTESPVRHITVGVDA